MGNTLVSAANRFIVSGLVGSRFNFVSAEYFDTVSLPILRGRAFTADEVKANVPDGCD
jgi:hypothetical protein